MFEVGTATDYADLLEKLDAFLTVNGSAFGLTYAGTGTGRLTLYKGGSASVAETFTVTATSATNFTVTGSVSGPLAAATVGVAYTGTKVQFTIVAGGTAFVSGDVFTLSTAPKWTSMRKARGCKVTANQSTSGQVAAENVTDGRSGADAVGRWWDVSSYPAIVEFEFFAAETVVEYAFSLLNGNGTLTWTFDRWDGATWVTLDSRTAVGAWSPEVFQSFTIATPVSATKYRLNVTAGSSGFQDFMKVELRRAVGGFNAAFSQYVWKAPGNDGTSEVYCGAHHFRRLDVDYFDWELASFDGFNAASSFYGQPGFHGRLYLPLWNASLPYWFAANGRRAVVVAKVNAQYELGFLGFGASYFTPNQLPYPAVLGGTLAHGDAPEPQWNDAAWRWSNSTDAHRMPTHSDPRQASKRPASFYQVRLRRLDGSWHGFRSSVGDSYVFSLPADEGTVWPYGAGIGTQLDVNLDGTYALYPVVLCDGAPNAYGELEGVAGVTGQGLSAESLVRVGAVDWLALHNVFRTDRDDFLAVRLD